ncbi:MAG: hypothetical protein AAGF97_09765 [Planctomycetota bacterium]
MSITLRSPIALAGLVFILSQTGCLTTSKFKSPQWLSFNRGDASVDASGLPDPSTLATPTTVTPAVTEPNVTLPGDAPQVAQNTSPPAASAGSSTTTHPAITNVAPASYPSTNQPAPTQLASTPSAGFLPSQTAPAAPNVQQGPYEQPPASPPVAPPQPVANAVAEVPAPPTQPPGVSTWDQPAQIPYPSGDTTGAPPMANPGSIYGGGPTASTTPPQSFTPPPSTPGGYPTAGTATNPPPPSQPLAQVGYDEPVSHYERTAQGGGSGWRPGSTTSLAPAVR